MGLVQWSKEKYGGVMTQVIANLESIDALTHDDTNGQHRPYIKDFRMRIMHFCWQTKFIGNSGQELFG
jgi:hypothetical protein